MSRVGWLLTILLSLLLVVGWYFLIFDPTSEDIESVRAETEQVRSLTTQELARAEQLRQVRQNAPESEAALAAGLVLIPEEAAIPALFRQLQQVADDAGVRLDSIAPSQPTVTTVGSEAEGTDIAVVSISMAITGSYFQIVDLTRRIEDPQIMGRALKWDAATLSPSDFPELTVALSGEVYGRGTDSLPVLEEDEPAPDDTGEEQDPDEAPTDGDVDPEDDVAAPEEDQ